MTRFAEIVQDLPCVGIEALCGGRGLVVIAPHQDDESLGCGGLIAQAVAQVFPVRIVFVSDGAGSHPQSKTHPAPVLAALRRDEALRAAQCLGVPAEAVTFLDLPDRHVPSTGPAAQAAARRIGEIARAVCAGAVFVTAASDPHTDHVAAFAIAREAMASLSAVKLWAYPIWTWHRDSVDARDWHGGVRLDVTDQSVVKRRAIDQHASQFTALIADDPRSFRMTDRQLAPFLQPFEVFVDVTP